MGVANVHRGTDEDDCEEHVAERAEAVGDVRTVGADSGDDESEDSE
jgi:hypothetical protein